MKDKSKPLLKEAKKTAQKDIQQNLVIQLTEITGKLGQVSKKLAKQIAKESRKLAKKLSKEIKFDKAALLEIDGQAKAANKAEVAKPAASNGKAKVVTPPTEPVVKKPAAKTTTV